MFVAILRRKMYVSLLLSEKDAVRAFSKIFKILFS